MVYLLAVGAAVCNAIASILQRRAAAPAGASHVSGLRLLWYLAHQRAWFAGIGALLAAFGFQAGALALGSVTQVQPVLATELLFALAILVLWFHRPVGPLEWGAGAAIVAGLVMFLVAGAPTPGRSASAGAPAWAAAGSAVLLVVLVAWRVARGGSSNRQAAALATAGGTMFAFTAALIEALTAAFAHRGLGAFAGWTPWSVAACGLAAMWLSNNAFERGPVPVAQPPLTIVDPLVSIALGVSLFGVTLRTGVFVVVEALGLVLLAGGVVALSRSPLASRDPDEGSRLQGRGTGDRQ
ncbi:MAG TPA: DMT family transporter [Acidimicrobiales bacterium]|nr:DMT family transporter [Acidimicrobiales bacterium]